MYIEAQKPFVCCGWLQQKKEGAMSQHYDSGLKNTVAVGYILQAFGLLLLLLGFLGMFTEFVSRPLVERRERLISLTPEVVIRSRLANIESGDIMIFQKQGESRQLFLIKQVCKANAVILESPHGMNPYQYGNSSWTTFDTIVKIDFVEVVSHRGDLNRWREMCGEYLLAKILKDEVPAVVPAK